MDMYQQELIDHYRNPRNKGTVSNPDFVGEWHNPSCGDVVSLSGSVAHGVITALAFEGSGCVISQAAASLLTVYCKNKALTYIQTLDAQCMQRLVGLTLGPVRMKCALLALEALQRAVTAKQDA
jgi:nitrogen fixation NifU-like protein